MEPSGLRRRCTYCCKELALEAFSVNQRTGKRITKCGPCNAVHLKSCHLSKIKKREHQRVALLNGDVVKTWLCSRCGEKPIDNFDFNSRLQKYQSHCKACMPITRERSKEHRELTKALMFVADVMLGLNDFGDTLLLQCRSPRDA